MSKVSFSKLYEIYVPMRDEIEDKLDKAKKLYKQNKTEENKRDLNVYKREFEMMNKVVNSLYYCMEKK